PLRAPPRASRPEAARRRRSFAARDAAGRRPGGAPGAARSLRGPPDWCRHLVAPPVRAYPVAQRTRSAPPGPGPRAPTPTRRARGTPHPTTRARRTYGPDRARAAASDLDRLRSRVGCAREGPLGTRLTRPEHAHELLFLDGFALEQRTHEPLELRAVLTEDLLRARERVVQDAPGLVFDDVDRRIARPALGRELLAEERMLGAVLVVHGADAIAHAPVRDHLEGELGGSLEVVLCARRDGAEDEPLGGVAPQHHAQVVAELGLGEKMPVLAGHVLGHAERHAARDDRDAL